MFLDVLIQLKEELSKEAFDDKTNLNMFIRKFSHSKSIPYKELMLLMRKVLSGLQVMSSLGNVGLKCFIYF